MVQAPVTESDQAPAEVVQDAPPAEPEAPVAEAPETPEVETPEPVEEKPSEPPKARKRSKPEPSFTDLMGAVQKHPEYEAHSKTEQDKVRTQEMQRLRREAGSKEQVTARTKVVLESAIKHANANDGELPRDITDNMSFVYDLAESNAAEHMLRGMAEHTLKALGVENAAETAQMLKADINQLGAYTVGLMEKASDVHKTKLDSEFDVRVKAEVAKQLQGEVDAKDLETTMANQPDTGPNAPTGSGATSKPAPTPQEYRAATPKQRADWAKEGVEVAIP